MFASVFWLYIINQYLVVQLLQKFSNLHLSVLFKYGLPSGSHNISCHFPGAFQQSAISVGTNFFCSYRCLRLEK
jgi:hypothetical protein